ncbi:MAG: ComF family protein [Propionibacteriaceae bacterium]|jgi:predicted amidophosphoribosyltransferase|nr:ComF family protein [Propionibacteriaceae bacterium]
MVDLLDAAADILLGAACPGCGQPGRRLCPGCAAALNQGAVRRRRRRPLEGLALWSAGDYAGLPQRLLHALKEERRWDVVDVLGGRLAAAVAGLLAESAWPGPIALVPVPSSAAAVRRRGLDVGRRLASAAQQRLLAAGVDARLCAVLRQRRRVADQAGLGWAERQANLDQACGLRPGWAAPGPERPGVVVDDVVTTGASLAEAWRALAAAGGCLLGAATMAATADRF